MRTAKVQISMPSMRSDLESLSLSTYTTVSDLGQHCPQIASGPFWCVAHHMTMSSPKHAALTETAVWSDTFTAFCQVK